MRLVSLLTALIVAGVLYGLVFERDRLFSFAGRDAVVELEDTEAVADADVPAEPVTEEAETQVAETTDTVAEGTVRVMALRSVAREVDGAVILRGETEAVRQVEARAETSGKVISDPLRKGQLVEAGQLLCELDPGTRDASLQEALARLGEAKARLPEAAARLAEAKASVPAAKARIAEAQANVPASEARLSEARANVPASEARLIEAEARVPEAQARLAEAQASVPAAEARFLEAEAQVPAARAALAEAEARLPESRARMLEAEARVREAEINLNAAQKLAQGGFAAQTRLAGAEAANESAKAGIQSALAGLKAAESGIEAAKSRLQGAVAGVETSRSQVASAKAAVQAAQSQIRNAEAGVQTARSQVEGARASVETALSAVEGAVAAVEAAKSQLEGAQAAVQAARTAEESALTGIQSAEAGIASADKEIERLQIHAPFAGLLETDTAELGTLLQPGGACATVIQLDRVKIVGFVPEIQISRVKENAPAGARLIDGREVVGTVSFVSRSSDPVTRTFRVEIILPNPDLSIRDGQTAEIAIEAEGAPAHLLPQSALTLNNEGELGVRTVTSDETALFVPVTLLRDTRHGVLVAGLPDTVDVITVGQEFVTDGVPVAPSFEEVIQ